MIYWPGLHAEGGRGVAVRSCLLPLPTCFLVLVGFAWGCSTPEQQRRLYGVMFRLLVCAPWSAKITLRFVGSCHLLISTFCGLYFRAPFSIHEAAYTTIYRIGLLVEGMLEKTSRHRPPLCKETQTNPRPAQPVVMCRETVMSILPCIETESN